MPIEPALTFQSEADFTSRFLVPLLRRLGYSIVAEYHGQREFGKNLVFGEIDRFAEVAYHGLQAKYQNSISQSDAEGLIEDCKQAFRNPFRHPNTGAEHRISSFVVANSGSIGDNARDNFFAGAINSEHGGNVRMFDGKALLALDRWATINRVEQVGGILNGLLIEVRLNQQILNAIEPMIREYLAHVPNPLPTERLRTSAMAHYVVSPVLPTMLDLNEVSSFLVAAECHVNGRLDHMVLPGSVTGRAESTNELLQAIGHCRIWLNRYEDAITSTMARLGPLAAL